MKVATLAVRHANTKDFSVFVAILALMYGFCFSPFCSQTTEPLGRCAELTCFRVKLEKAHIVQRFVPALSQIFSDFDEDAALNPLLTCPFDAMLHALMTITYFCFKSR